MAKTTNDPAATEPPAELTEDERAELERLREENSILAAEIDDLHAERAERGADRVSLTTDAAPSDADRRRTIALHEKAVMDRSEGARLDREQQTNIEHPDTTRRDIRFADTPASAAAHADRRDDAVDGE